MTELWHILTDPAHWMAEIVMDTVYTIPVYYLGKWRVRAHDRKVHNIKKDN